MFITYRTAARLCALAATLTLTTTAHAAPGALDLSFSGDGKVKTDFGSGSFERVRALVLQPNGKFVVAGFTDSNGSLDFALARYLENGTLDTTFDGDGKVLTDFGNGSVDNATALVRQAGGTGTSCWRGSFPMARQIPASGRAAG